MVGYIFSTDKLIFTDNWVKRNPNLFYVTIIADQCLLTRNGAINEHYKTE